MSNTCRSTHPHARLSLRLSLFTIAGAINILVAEPVTPSQRSASDDAGFPRFRDIARRSGIDSYLDSGSEDRTFLLEQSSAGVLVIDIDNDAWLDIYLVNGSTPARMDRGQKSRGNRLYRNNRNATFTDVTTTAGVSGNGAWGMGGCVGDVDNNGLDDIFVTNYGPDVLYLNSGEGRFHDATKSAGIEGGNRWHTGCAFADYDRDGDLDLYVSTYAVFTIENARKDPRLLKVLRAREAPVIEFKRTDGAPRGAAAIAGLVFDALGPNEYPAHPDEFYENVGGGRFIDVSETSGIRRAQARSGSQGSSFSVSATILSAASTPLRCAGACRSMIDAYGVPWTRRSSSSS